MINSETLQKAAFIFFEAFTCVWLLLAGVRLTANAVAKLTSKRNQPVVPALSATDGEGSSPAVREFDTRWARPLLPAVAAQRFVDWMRLNEFTDHLWIGELDECYLWFCRESNTFPVEPKTLREFLYQCEGVSWGRPRIGGAAWERFRRQMENWHSERGLQCPCRPVVVRILPCEVLPSVRVRKRSDEEHVAGGREFGSSPDNCGPVQKIFGNQAFTSSPTAVRFGFRL